MLPLLTLVKLLIIVSEIIDCVLSGCTLLFYETYGKNMSAEQDVSPRYALLADDSIVQAVPEHPKRENVFCLSNSHGDVFLFQVSLSHMHTSILTETVFRGTLKEILTF